MIEVTLETLQMSLVSQHRVAVLREIDVERYLPILIGLPIALIWPVWYLRNRRRPTSPLVALLPLPGLLLWLVLLLLRALLETTWLRRVP